MGIRTSPFFHQKSENWSFYPSIKQMQRDTLERNGTCSCLGGLSTIGRDVHCGEVGVTSVMIINYYSINLIGNIILLNGCCWRHRDCMWLTWGFPDKRACRHHQQNCITLHCTWFCYAPVIILFNLQSIPGLTKEESGENWRSGNKPQRKRNPSQHNQV